MLLLLPRAMRGGEHESTRTSLLLLPLPLTLPPLRQRRWGQLLLLPLRLLLQPQLRGPRPHHELQLLLLRTRGPLRRLLLPRMP